MRQAIRADVHPAMFALKPSPVADVADADTIESDDHLLESRIMPYYSADNKCQKIRAWPGSLLSLGFGMETAKET
jgi:hypothetical protein